MDRAVAAAIQAGRLPAAREAWGRDLCPDKPDEFARFLNSSPFDLGAPTVTVTVTALGKPPSLASAMAPPLDAADAITAERQLAERQLKDGLCTVSQALQAQESWEDGGTDLGGQWRSS